MDSTEAKVSIILGFALIGAILDMIVYYLFTEGIIVNALLSYGVTSISDVMLVVEVIWVTMGVFLAGAQR